MEFDRAQLKRSVKQSMKGTSSKPMLVTLLFSVVVSVGTWLINTILGRLLTGGVGSISDTALYYLQQGYEVEDAVNIALLELFRMGPGAMFGAVVGGAVLSILVSLWGSTMNVGYQGYCLSMVRNEDPPMGKIFCALPQFGQVLVTRILTGIFEMLWVLLVAVGYTVVLVVAVLLDIPVISGLLVVADIVALVLGVIWVTMRYALVDFVLLDKGLSGLDAVRESKRLMQGNIGRGFVLQLSFAGWYLLMLVIIYGGVMLAIVPFLNIAVSSGTGGMIAASGAMLLIILAAAIAVAVLSLWLRPYTGGCWAKFYDWAKSGLDSFSGSVGGVGPGNWGEHKDYTWSSGGPSSGTGMGQGPGNGGPPHNPPKPRDDPWN